MTKVVILGGGMGGFFTAQALEKKAPAGVEVTLVDMRPHVVYQPFLAEVAGSAIDARDIQVPLRRHLRRTNVVLAKVVSISHKHRSVRVRSAKGAEWDIEYDQLIIALGAVTRVFPTPGIVDAAIGLKSSEEAISIRNRMIDNFYEAANHPKGSPERKRLLTFVVVGGGFSGAECFGELSGLAHELCRKTQQIDDDEVELHLIEVSAKILPEVRQSQSEWVRRKLEARNAHVHVETYIESAEDGVVRTSDGKEYPTDLIVWTAGQLANPVLQQSDVPLDTHGRVTCLPTLQVFDLSGKPIEGLWALGDCAGVPDLTGGGLPDGSCAPTAQHAARQAKRLVKNLIAVLQGGTPEEYRHKNLGMVAGLGRHTGVFVNGTKSFGMNGFFAWFAHRLFHLMALPTAERRLRVCSGWFCELVAGKDLTPTSQIEDPHAFFREFAPTKSQIKRNV